MSHWGTSAFYIYICFIRTKALQFVVESVFIEDLWNVSFGQLRAAVLKGTVKGISEDTRKDFIEVRHNVQRVDLKLDLLIIILIWLNIYLAIPFKGIWAMLPITFCIWGIDIKEDIDLYPEIEGQVSWQQRVDVFTLTSSFETALSSSGVNIVKGHPGVLSKDTGCSRDKQNQLFTRKSTTVSTPVWEWVRESVIAESSQIGRKSGAILKMWRNCLKNNLVTARYEYSFMMIFKHISLEVPQAFWELEAPIEIIS